MPFGKSEGVKSPETLLSLSNLFTDFKESFKLFLRLFKSLIVVEELEFTILFISLIILVASSFALSKISRASIFAFSIISFSLFKTAEWSFERSSFSLEISSASLAIFAFSNSISFLVS